MEVSNSRTKMLTSVPKLKGAEMRKTYTAEMAAKIRAAWAAKHPSEPSETLLNERSKALCDLVESKLWEAREAEKSSDNMKGHEI